MATKYKLIDSYFDTSTKKPSFLKAEEGGGLDGTGVFATSDVQTIIATFDLDPGIAYFFTKKSGGLAKDSTLDFVRLGMDPFGTGTSTDAQDAFYEFGGTSIVVCGISDKSNFIFEESKGNLPSSVVNFLSKTTGRADAVVTYVDADGVVQTAKGDAIYSDTGTDKTFGILFGQGKEIATHKIDDNTTYHFYYCQCNFTNKKKSGYYKGDGNTLVLEPAE